MNKNSFNPKPIIGFTCGAFDLFHAGHVLMLEEAKQHCDYLIVGLQSDPSVDRNTKNTPVQTIVERQVQVKGCRHVDEVIVYDTEKDLEDLLKTLPIDVRIIGSDYKDKDFTGKDYCMDNGIQIIFNRRDHSFSTTDLRTRVYHAEYNKFHVGPHTES
jgi:glycerol-3-phosphate cytidylyltransferase